MKALGIVIISLCLVPLVASITAGMLTARKRSFKIPLGKLTHLLN